MARKKYTVEQIIVKLREVEVLCGQAKTIAEQALDIAILKDVELKKLLSPVKRKATVAYVMDANCVTERGACRALSMNRTASVTFEGLAIFSPLGGLGFPVSLFVLRAFCEDFMGALSVGFSTTVDSSGTIFTLA